MGRFRTVIPDDETLVALGEEMIHWVNENKPSHLSHWYVLQKAISRRAFKDHYRYHPIFSPYYEIAMTIIGKRYLECDGIKEGIAQRWQRIYFPDLQQEEDDSFSFRERVKSDVVKESKVTVTEEQKQHMDELMNQMRNIQKNQTDSNSAFSNNNNE